MCLLTCGFDDSGAGGRPVEPHPPTRGIEEAVMRRTMVVGVLVGAAVLVGSPALAAPPEVSERSCEEAQGTFGRERGVKSCTTTSSVEVPRAPVTLIGQVPLSQNQYIGVSRRIDTVETTTVESQKGNGEVTSTSSDAVVASRVEQLSCTYRVVSIVGGGLFGGGFTVIEYHQRPLADCASRGLFLTA
jgi:hypothetical protein